MRITITLTPEAEQLLTIAAHAYNGPARRHGDRHRSMEEVAAELLSDALEGNVLPPLVEQALEDHALGPMMEAA